MVEIAPGTEVRVARRAVAAVVPPDEEEEVEEEEETAALEEGKSVDVTRKSAANLLRCFRESQTAPHPRCAHRRRTHRGRALAIPGSPLEQSPTLGLDLQGGLEVTLKAVPPANRPCRRPISTVLSRSSETASTA